MVFTHLPSNILLMLVPLMPNLPLAIAVLLLRFSISQMDVPTRQSYTMAVVAPDERSAASGVTGVARTIGASLSPIFTGLFLANPALLGLPFFISGGLKIVYDLLLYRSFIACQTAGRTNPSGCYKGDEQMKWITRSHVHVDRVACPWLITRFVDNEAEFLFVPAGEIERVAQESGAIPFDAPGVELGHHEGRCSFESIILRIWVERTGAAAPGEDRPCRGCGGRYRQRPDRARLGSHCLRFQPAFPRGQGKSGTPV